MIGEIPYHATSVDAILARADGSLTTEDIIAGLSREWDCDPALTAILVLPILNELLRMEAITLH